MSITIHSPKNRTSINWAGGTSTEIFIHPSDGSFADRNFLFRISTATVEVAATTFTHFEGIIRHLMLLKGGLKLIHDGRYTRHLKPYEQDTFSGEWSTHSKGKVTDFNLMLKGETTGSLTHHSIHSGAAAAFHSDSDFYFIYVATGCVTSDDGIVGTMGDLIQIGKGNTLQLQGEGELVTVSVVLGAQE